MYHSLPSALALLAPFLGTVATICKLLVMSPFAVMTIMVLKAPAADMAELAEAFSRWFGARPPAGSRARERQSPPDGAGPSPGAREH